MWGFCKDTCTYRHMVTPVVLFDWHFALKDVRGGVKGSGIRPANKLEQWEASNQTDM
jgi:hypothetical protein